MLTRLPYTIFFEIIAHLSAVEALSSRRISADIRSALTRPDLCISLILLHFPRSLESRTLRGYLRNNDEDALEQGDWAAVFAILVRRYYHLGNATAWKVDKVGVAKGPALRGVTPWNRFLRLDEKTAAFDYWDPVWTVSATDGVLVYPAEGSGAIVYRARDLGSGEEVCVPFDTGGKVVRRVRLSHGILVFEWCEEEGYHELNEGEAAHRHFATAFDVVRRQGWDGIIPRRRNSRHNGAVSSEDSQSPWVITYRSEWKIHYLGLPLSHQDRFFSTHNATHYAVYIWQPTRSPWGEDEPLERLIIWEIGDPHPYRPSLDPSGRNTPNPSSTTGPRIAKRLVNNDLSTWGIRQSDTPSLRSLALDNITWDEDTNSHTGHVFFLQEEHRWCAGPHSSPNPPRQHRLHATGIPILSDGPAWVDDCGGPNSLTDYDLFCSRGKGRHEGDKWPGKAPCWRHDDFPYLTVSEVYDVSAGVRITARHCFMMETLSVHVRPQLCVVQYEGDTRMLDAGGKGEKMKEKRSLGPDGEEVRFDDDMWGELLGKGCIFGDERWVVGEDENGDITILTF